ncbi:conserved hypothetical protein [Culex quinquefasciatus]|uniref:Autophagy-related protein 2 n=1 Tax=Culex quinquefasciatus TaxID=7176 RepID=B0X650_CULQU|nr:conserved hypothetical protein [Culex quinquefasciatus]|eukprot:XP_001865122.1 conserved hypothetical protein [Culex quinquefasciatus]
MPWYAPWSNVIKKKVCRFLLQRYLGQFLEERLSLDQLTVDFYNGTGTVYDVTLYCQLEAELGCTPGSQTKRNCFSMLVKITDCSSFSANFSAARSRSVERATLALNSWQLYILLSWLGFVAASSWMAGAVQTGCALLGSERSSTFTSPAPADCRE